MYSLVLDTSTKYLYISLVKDETVISERNGLLLVRPKKGFLADKNYQFIFDRSDLI